MTSTKLADLIDAFDNQGDGVTQYLDLQTGRIVLVTEDFAHIESEDDVDADEPEWAQEQIAEVLSVHREPDRYLELPPTNTLVNLGTLRAFAHTLPSAQRDAILDVIGGKGSFRRFKDVTDDLGLRSRWDSFRLDVLEQHARRWCEEHGVQLE